MTALLNFCFDFDWPKDDDENLKHEIEYMIKNNEYLNESEIKRGLNDFY